MLSPDILLRRAFLAASMRLTGCVVNRLPKRLADSARHLFERLFLALAARPANFLGVISALLCLLLWTCPASAASGDAPGLADDSTHNLVAESVNSEASAPTDGPTSGMTGASASGLTPDSLNGPLNGPLNGRTPAAAGKNGGENSMTQTTGEQPWTLEADKVVSLDDGVIVEASGDVVLRRGDDYLMADFARYFTTTDWVYTEGNVRVKLGRDELKATKAEFDLSSNTGWLTEGSVFMAGPHIYFTGGDVIKHWGDRYTFKNAKVTACDGPVPAWSVAAQEAVVEIDGYATLSHTTMQVKDANVFYTPFMVLPAKTTRQSGLLMPDMGMSSKLGAYITLPWYQVLDQSRDMTIYGTWMERRGFMPAVEYRSHTGDNDKTWMGLDLLYDNKLVTNDLHDPVDNTDGKIRGNHERFWLRGMSQGQIADSQWRYKYNLDYVSDQNFLREFRNRMTGFDSTRRALYDYFGRDLQEMDQNRVTEGYIYRDWERFGLTFGGRYEQNPALGHGNATRQTDTTPQHLPELTAYLYKGRLIPELPLEVEASGSTTYIYRAMGTTGGRTEIYPRISLPLDLKYATVIAGAGLRQTFYNSSKIRGTSFLSPNSNDWSKQTGTRRTMPDVSLTAFTQASRIWKMDQDDPLKASPDNVGKSQWTSVRHQIQPRFTYTWVPNITQERNPFYTLDDRILPDHELYLSLTNLFTARRQTVVANPAPQGQKSTSASLMPDYLSFARLRFGLGYDIGEANRIRHRELFPRRPFTDFLTEATLTPYNWLSFWTQTYLSMYGDGLTRNDVGLTLSNARWGFTSVSYSRRNRYYNYRQQVQYENLKDMRFENKLSLLSNEVNLRVFPKWDLSFTNTQNLITGQNYERRFMLTYRDQCFQLVGRFIATGRERSYQFSVVLLGIN